VAFAGTMWDQRPDLPWRDPGPVEVQRVLDALPGASALFTPVRDAHGRLIDLVVAAVTPEAVAPGGRRGRELIGTTMSGWFPEATDRWAAFARVLSDGEPAHLPAFPDHEVRVHRVGGGLLLSWVRRDVTERETSAQRLAEVERDLAAEHALAATLQQIILPIPDGPLELPGLKVALRYLPAGQESLVGGDWYHAAEARDGSVLLAVGDVAGHGTHAATTMAQLRHALRALSVVTTDPAVLLGHLNRLTCELERESPELAATAVVARFDPVSRRLTWAQAGHPPPLLCQGGRTMPLARPHGCMLGVVEDAAYATATLDLAYGDVLLLYTDGLVEHRRRGPDDGLRAVLTAIDDAVSAAPERPLEQVVNLLRQANPDDDTCILAVRMVTGETRDLRHFLNR
jgi:serine phosphatase RsbU (regulator of sigma subunit)